MRLTRRGIAACSLLALTLGSELAAQEPAGFPVCVGADRVVRHWPDGKCPPGQSLYRLAEAGDEIDTPSDVSGQPPGKPPGGAPEAAALASRLDQLAQRVAALEAQGPVAPSPAGKGVGNRVTAPFEVVDRAGKVVFNVTAEPRAFRLFMPTGQIVVSGSALPGGGNLKALAKDQGLETVMGVNNDFAGFVARQGKTARAILSIHDGGKASVEVSNDDGTTVATLLHGPSGGGQLQLGDAAGNAMVEAGVTADGTGLVRAHPLGNPGAGLLGLPGTFIVGRK
jgi:hypothetical protein